MEYLRIDQPHVRRTFYESLMERRNEQIAKISSDTRRELIDFLCVTVPSVSGTGIALVLNQQACLTGDEALGATVVSCLVGLAALLNRTVNRPKT